MSRKKASERNADSFNPQSFEADVEQVPSVVTNDSIHSENGEHIVSKKKFDFTALANAEKKQSVDDYTEYQAVLREIARDECTRSEAEILRLLERCDRDTQDLQTDVQWRTKRDEQIAEIRREQEYRDKNEELLAELRKMRAEFEAFEEEYRKKRNPIIWESDRLDDKIRQVSSFRDELLESCRDTNLKMELEILENSFDDRIERNLYERQRAVGDEIDRLEQELNHLPITVNRHDRKKELKKEIKRRQEEWQELETKKSEIEQKKAEHKAAVQAMRERLIFA